MTATDERQMSGRCRRLDERHDRVLRHVQAGCLQGDLLSSHRVLPKGE